jgi:hypothetical protein
LCNYIILKLSQCLATIAVRRGVVNINADEVLDELAKKKPEK